MAQIDILRQRLINQMISHPIADDPAQVVKHFVAMQAQDYTAALWAIGLRLAGSTEEDVDQAMTRGAILRTHTMRPTWHFVTPADIRWLQTLTSARVHQANANMYRQQSLDARTFSKANKAIENALAGGKQLTRNELSKELSKKAIHASGLRLIYILMHAEWTP